MIDALSVVYRHFSITTTERRQNATFAIQCGRSIKGEHMDREKVIEEIISNIQKKRYGCNSSTREAAKAIIDLPFLAEYFQSQPVELWAERECPTCKGKKSYLTHKYAQTICNLCKGSGHICRQITMKEAAEIFISVMPPNQKTMPYKILTGDENGNGTYLKCIRSFLLPSGEKVRRRTYI